MKDKVFYTKAVEMVESLARELRAYSAEPMYFSVSIFTRDEMCHHADDPEGIPDFYSFRFCKDTQAPDFLDHGLGSKAARIYYSEDGKIMKVIDYHGEDDKEEE